MKTIKDILKIEVELVGLLAKLMSQVGGSIRDRVERRKNLQKGATVRGWPERVGKTVRFRNHWCV